MSQGSNPLDRRAVPAGFLADWHNVPGLRHSVFVDEVAEVRRSEERGKAREHRGHGASAVPSKVDDPPACPGGIQVRQKSDQRVCEGLESRLVQDVYAGHVDVANVVGQQPARGQCEGDGRLRFSRISPHLRQSSWSQKRRVWVHKSRDIPERFVGFTRHLGTEDSCEHPVTHLGPIHGIAAERVGPERVKRSLGIGYCFFRGIPDIVTRQPLDPEVVSPEYSGATGQGWAELEARRTWQDSKCGLDLCPGPRARKRSPMHVVGRNDRPTLV